MRTHEKKKGKKESRKNHKSAGQGTDSSKQEQRDQATGTAVITRDQATDGTRLVTKDQGTEVTKPPQKDQATDIATVSMKTTGVITDPAVTEGTQSGGRQRRLQIAPQGWINIRKENVAEVHPGVSIIPRPHHNSGKQTTHTLVEYVHPHSATEESASEIDEATRKCLPMDEWSPDRGPEVQQIPVSIESHRSHASDGNRSDADDIHQPVEPGLSAEDALGTEHPPVDDESRSRHQDVGVSRTDDSSPKSPVQASMGVLRAADDDPKDEPLNDRLGDARKQPTAERPQTEYVYIVQDDAEPDLPEERSIENVEGGDEDGDLPGYMPSVQWREVTIESRMFEDDGQRMERRMLQEAEERLLEHDRRHRLLNRYVYLFL